MARNIVPIILTGDYVPDRGGAVPLLSYRAAQPADMADADFDALLGLVGARRKTEADGTPCPVAADFRPRKLVFTRADGNSFSLVVPDHDTMIGAAQAVKDAVPANPIVCVRSEGEEWFDLFPVLPGARVGAPTAGTPSRVTTGAIQRQHSGKIAYEYDGGAGVTITQAVRVDTDVVDATTGETSAPSIVAGPWATCVGDFQPSNPCPSRSGLEPRHYTATLLTSDADNPYQQTQIPMRSSQSTLILGCGNEIAGLPSTVCLAYKGERNIRLHTLLT